MKSCLFRTFPTYPPFRFVSFYRDTYSTACSLQLQFSTGYYVPYLIFALYIPYFFFLVMAMANVHALLPCVSVACGACLPLDLNSPEGGRGVSSLESWRTRNARSVLSFSWKVLHAAFCPPMLHFMVLIVFRFWGASVCLFVRCQAYPDGSESSI